MSNPTNGEKENRFSYPTLNPRVVSASGSGSPSIEPRDLVRHKMVRDNIRKGAKSGLGERPRENGEVEEGEA